jgi:flagellar hook-basal body complex protein FliE
MSTVSPTQVNQVLAQMRVMAAQAASQQPKAEQAGSAGFSQLLQQSISEVNNAQMQAGQMKTSFETGEGNLDLAQVMIASQKANLSFQAMVQVRNKLVDAYKDVMNMPI